MTFKRYTMKPLIVVNAIRTPDGTIVRSNTKHHFAQHEDANGNTYAVDGGTSYIRRVCSAQDYTELSVYTDSPHEDIRTLFEWGTYGKRGDQQLTWVKLMSMETAHIKAILKKERLVVRISKVFEDELQYRNHKCIRFALAEVLRAAEQYTCENMHHRSRDRHEYGMVCPVEYRLNQQIDIIRKYMQDNGV